MQVNNEEGKQYSKQEWNKKNIGKLPSSGLTCKPIERKLRGKERAQVEALTTGFSCNPLLTIVYIESFQVRFCMSGEFYA